MNPAISANLGRLPLAETVAKVRSARAVREVSRAILPGNRHRTRRSPRTLTRSCWPGGATYVQGAATTLGWSQFPIPFSDHRYAARW